MTARGEMMTDVEIEMAMDVAWERTFGDVESTLGIGSSAADREAADREEVEDDPDPGDSGTVLCVSPHGAAARRTHASIEDALRHELRKGTEKGAEDRLSYVAEPSSPLRFVCLVEHVEVGDAFLVAAPTLGELKRVVLERRASRRISGRAKLTWVPMQVGSERER